MPGSWSPSNLPFLTEDNHSIESPRKNRYNCLSWAAGSKRKWWSPIKPYFWPPEAPREATIEAFVRAFETLGYAVCADGSLELGIEKLAIFARTDPAGNLVATHAARQLPNGRWTSKLGPLEDIEHLRPEDVNGPTYGAPLRYMSRVK